MNQYIISKGQKLSNIMPQIESNINLAKKFPGIGATYLEIHSPRPSILIEPNVPVIQGKCAKSDKDFKVFGVYEGVSVDKITDYLQEPYKYHKLMTRKLSKNQTSCQQCRNRPLFPFLLLDGRIPSVSKRCGL